MAPRTRGRLFRKYAKSHSGPLQPSADDTPSRRCALQPFSCFPFFLSRAAVLDAASSGAAAAIQCCFSWEQPLFVAAWRHRRCLAAVQRHARREQKVVCGLRQVRSLRMLIRARTTSISACQTMLFRCALPTSPRLTAHPAAFAEHTTDLSPVPSLGCEMLLPVVALARAAQAIAWTALEL